MTMVPLATTRLSRRRALALSSAAAALLATAPARRLAAQEATPTTGATPEAGAEALPTLPMPSTLAADASSEFKAIAEAVVAAMQSSLVPGVAIGLLAGDREEHATFGVASLSSLNPVTPNTLFQIGSVSKTYTSSAIWHLIDKGMLQLDAPVRTYLPDFTLLDEEAAATVTVGQLMDHSAGFYGDGGTISADDDGAVARYVRDEFPTLPQIFPVGELFSYNNAAFILQGRLLEVATGAVYNAAIEDIILAPLGLQDSVLDFDTVRQREDYADGHVAMPINGHMSVAVQTPLWVPRYVGPAGAIWATTRDMIRYARFHLDTGLIPGAANVVSPESLLQMREPAITVPGFPLQMGRDWFVQDVEGQRAFFHSGDTMGQHTDFLAIPGENFALVVLTNGQSGGALVALEALNAALAQFPALAPLAGKVGLTQTILAPADAPEATLATEELAEYVGSYGDPSATITIAPQGDGLELSVELHPQPGSWQPAIQSPPIPTTPLTFLAKDMSVNQGILIPFVRNADGEIKWISFGVRLAPRLDS